MSANGWKKRQREVVKIDADYRGSTLHLDPESLVGVLQDKVAEAWQVHTIFESACREYAQAHCDYRLARSVAYLKAEGTQGQREAIRDQAVDKEYRLEQVAEAKKEAFHQRLMTLRLEISGLQSILSVQRAEMQLAGAKVL